MDSLIHNFDNGREGYVANSVEQVFLLPQDKAEFRNLKKHEMFSSLKRDLALVCSPFSFLLLFTSNNIITYYYFIHLDNT